jgi:hypothetical protein
MTVTLIQFTPASQRFLLTLGGVEYTMRLRWIAAVEGIWVLDIEQPDGTAMVNGIPLVTGSDLLAQYRHLELGAQLIVASAGDVDALPTFEGLGSVSQLYMVTP